MNINYKTPVLLISTMFLSLFLVNCEDLDFSPKNKLSENDSLLFESTIDGVKAGSKAVSKEILSNLGKALLNSYSPTISDLLFGKSNELESATRIIVGEIQETGGDLAKRLRAIDDNINDQFAAELEGNFRRASNILNGWLTSEDLYFRTQDLHVLSNQWETFEDIRVTIEQYIKREGNVKNQLDRLKLLELHIISAQLAATSNQHYYSTLAIKVAFQKSNFGTDAKKFQEWIQSLNDEQIRTIETSIIQSYSFRSNVFEEVLDFYGLISQQNYLEEYMEIAFSPPVSHMVQFTGDLNKYDNQEHLNNLSNWNTLGNTFTKLDGLRWYYYVNIPNKNCLEGYAFQNLKDRKYVPWVEVAQDPSSSDCNRFWIVDLYLNSSGWPNTYLSSIDGYKVWFKTPENIYSIHKLLEKGQILREIYGPISLVLNRMHKELNITSRQKNNWDIALDRYDIENAYLGIPNSYTDGISYEVIQKNSEDLKNEGLIPGSIGLEKWFKELKSRIN